MTDQNTEGIDKQEALRRLGRVDVYKVDPQQAHHIYAALLTGPARLGNVYYSAPKPVEKPNGDW